MVRAFLAAAAAAVAAAPAFALEVKLCALAEARAPGWPALPADAPLDRERLSWRRRVPLEPTRAIPVRAPEVRRALDEALAGLKGARRKQLGPVLDAIGEWFAARVADDPAPPGNPAGWRSGDQVLREGKGNGFEQVRALAALVRAAGIPARPSCNGVPLLLVYAAPADRPGFWTAWDPLHPGASAARLPPLWVPLRAEDVVPVETSPAALSCTVLLEGRRFASREEAAVVYQLLTERGAFPAGAGPALPASAESWWEVWSVGVACDLPAAEAATVRLVYPFAKDAGLTTREHAVWTSEPARLGRVSRPLARTDQELGGLLMRVEVALRPAPAPGPTP